jgi:hypothetical protein
MRCHRYLGWFLLLALLPFGCGPSGPMSSPVSGSVTMDNKPLPNATVTFTPANMEPGKPVLQATGVTDAQGHYSLKLDKDGREGLPEGSYQVRVSIFDRSGERGHQLVPEEYNQRTTLSFTVPPGGSKEANFPLLSNPNWRR